jgi:hypothetical protein
MRGISWTALERRAFRYRCDVHEICPPVGLHPAWNGSSVPTFRDNISVPSSRVKHSKKEGNGRWGALSFSSRTLPSGISQLVRMQKNFLRTIYPCAMVRCYCLMSKVVYSAIQGRGPEQNPQYKQRSRTIYIINERQLRMWYVYNKLVLFFVPSSIKYVFCFTRFPQLSVRTRTKSADNRQHCVSSSNKQSYAADVTAGVSDAPLL